MLYGRKGEALSIGRKMGFANYHALCMCVIFDRKSIVTLCVFLLLFEDISKRHDIVKLTVRNVNDSSLMMCLRVNLRRF